MGSNTMQPRIGIDRFVHVEWMALAASVVRGEMSVDGLHVRLAADIPGVQVQRKTFGILKRMWFPSDEEAGEVANTAARIEAAGGGVHAAACEAVAISAYPYFRQVVAHVGRLLRLQETCSAGEVHRRMFEQHGKRTTIDQATSYAFKTMVSWSMIERQPSGRLGRARPIDLPKDAKHLLDLAANRSRRSVTPMSPTDPLLFAFGDT